MARNKALKRYKEIMEFSEFFVKMWFPINNVSINKILK